MSFPANNQTIASSSALAGSAISYELHQTAQPLTVLQGILELAMLSSGTAEEYRGVIQNAMEQSQRISGSLDLVRRLVHFQQSPGDLSSFSISETVRTVVESFKDNYAAAGVECRFPPPSSHASGLDLVTASEGRVAGALALILANLPRWAKPGGTVEVAIELDSHSVRIRINARQQDGKPDRRTALHPSPMTAPLQLACTMVNSTGGSVTQSEPEFSVVISLPKMQYNPELYEAQRIERVHV
ncbi:MAG: sensor histidine kinase [Terriglobales bacterium]